MIPEIQSKQLARLLTASLSFACAAIPARTQDSEPRSVYDLDTIVAVANRHDLPLGQVGSSVEVLEGFELRRGEQAFLLDSLRSVPGFYFRNSGGAGGTFGMTTRGLNVNRPTVLINGLKVSNPASGQMVNLGNLFVGGVARVEALKGPQSSLYGADALAGVISIDTSSVDRRPGGYAAASYGAYETYNVGLGYSGTAGALDFAIDANRYESAGFSVQDPALGAPWEEQGLGNAWADNDRYDNDSLSASLRYQLSEGAALEFAAYHFTAYAEFDPGDPAWVWGEPNFDNYSEDEQLLLKLGSDLQVSDRWNSKFSLGYANVNSLSYSGAHYRTNGDRYQVDWLNTVEASERWTIVGGAGFEIEDNRSDIGDRDNTSLFAENILSLSEATDITFGMRYDDNSVYGSKATYRGTFSHQLEAIDARLRGSYGSSFQAPSFYQLFSFYGTPDLKPENGKGWDLGIDKQLLDGRLRFSTAVFGNEVDDKIIYDFGPSKYANESYYESYGLESSLRMQVTDSWRIGASHTYSKGRYEEGMEAERVPRNVYSLDLLWTGFDGRLDLNAVGYFVSSQFSFAGDTAKQDGYNTVNLSARYRVAETYSVWLRLDNAFDEDYVEVAGYLTPGASLYAGMHWEF